MAPHPTLRPYTGLNLALAVIVSSTAPLLLLDGDLTLIAASKSFCLAFAIDPVTATRMRFMDLGAGEWDKPQLTSLLRATATDQADVEGYEIDLKRPGQKDRQLVLNARKLTYGDGSAVRLLVAVLDVTEARIAEKLQDELLKEKTILLQELQHRVANSLQIIASVLMQSARKVQSEEARSHLHDAHQRVMSVASLQSQLAASAVGNVELRRYLTSVCHSIAASMIRDHNHLTLNLNIDDTVTTAGVSASLGLIVTELVINALKHAFPGDRGGKILVNYQSQESNWILSVCDDGVGMPIGDIKVKPGLGTSIVQALSAQLRAVIKVSDRTPGTSIQVAHFHAESVNDTSLANGRPV